MAPRRHSLFHRARYPLRIFQLRLRSPGPHSTGSSAHVPDLPGCVAAATTLADARQLIEGMRMNGDTVPPPTLHIKEIDFAV